MNDYMVAALAALEKITEGLNDQIEALIELAESEKLTETVDDLNRAHVSLERFQDDIEQVEVPEE